MGDNSSTSGRLTPSEEGACDWYYRIGERERGPLTLAQLKDLVASSGDVARDIVVKHHANGEWVPYETIDPTTARRLRADQTTENVRPETIRKGTCADERVPSLRSSRHKRGSHFGKQISWDWPIVAGVAVWMVVNVVLWNVLDPSYRTERKYFQFLVDAAEKARDARARGFDDQERGRIAARVIEEARPIVQDLKKSANASEPVRQHLLWAAKEQLPRLFAAKGKELDACEIIFQRHMHEAGRRLGIDVPLPQTSVVVP